MPSDRPAATGSACNLCAATGPAPVIRKDGFDLVRCRACGLLYVDNPPDDAQRARLYSFEAGYHAELVEDRESQRFHEREARRNFATLRRFVTRGRLLDVGCSIGLFLCEARRIGWVGRGLEYSPDSSRIARDVHGLDVATGELREDTFAPASFDVVTLWDVIEHLPDPKATVDLLARLLAPGGMLVLKTPNADGLYPQISLRAAARLGFWGHAEPPGHLYQFSESTLRKVVEQAGLEVLGVQHLRIPISYSFGRPGAWFRSLKWAAYCALFIPMAWIGPWLRRGDDQVLVARRGGAAPGTRLS